MPATSEQVTGRHHSLITGTAAVPQQPEIASELRRFWVGPIAAASRCNELLEAFLVAGA
jgi:hypothetical protein